MIEIAKWFYQQAAIPIAERITSLHKTPVRGFGGVDFINSFTIAMLNSMTTGVLFYKNIWIALIAGVIMLSAHTLLWLFILKEKMVIE